MGCAIYIGNGINWKIKKKMKGEHYFNYLTKEEQNLFKTNTERVGRPWSWVMNEANYKTFVQFISSSFTWHDTPEGFEYWHGVSLKSIKNIVPKYKMNKFKFV